MQSLALLNLCIQFCANGRRHCYRCCLRCSVCSVFAYFLHETFVVFIFAVCISQCAHYFLNIGIWSIGHLIQVANCTETENKTTKAKPKLKCFQYDLNSGAYLGSCVQFLMTGQFCFFFSWQCNQSNAHAVIIQSH